MNSCRQIGMDAGPIPWTAIDAYAARHRLDEMEYDELLTCMRTLDGVRTKHVAAQRDKRAKK